MCCSNDFVGGVSEEERKSIEADPVLRDWEKFYYEPVATRWTAQMKREQREHRVLNVLVLVLICFGVTCFFAVLALK